MEYLTTYGWAILIIAATVSILYYFVSTPSTFVPSSCRFSLGVYCQDLTVGGGNVLLFLTNSQQYTIINPSVTQVSIGGANSLSTTSCLPANVLPGGIILCTVELTQALAPGSSITGSLYFSAITCPSGNAQSCNSLPTQNYIGTFNTQAGPAISSNLISSNAISISWSSPFPSNAVANGAGYPITATVTLSSSNTPLEGATVAFTAGGAAKASPSSTTTDSDGNAQDSISSTSAGTYNVVATFAGVSSSPLSATFASAPSVPTTTIPATTTVLSYSLTLSANPSSDGTASAFPSASSYPQGTIVTITATPNACYAFTGWSGSGLGSYTGPSATASVQVNGAIAETANFQVVGYPLTLASSPSGGGTASALPSNSLGCSLGYYVSGQAITLSETANLGYAFGGWTGYSTTNTFTMPANAAAETTNFEPYVTLQANPAAAASTWGACFQYTPPGGSAQPQVCTDPASSVSVAVPYGSEITYLATGIWQTPQMYTFVSYSGSVSTTVQSSYNNFLAVTSPATITANYAQPYITLTENPTAAAAQWAVCMAWLTPNGAQQGQQCVYQSPTSITVQVPYASQLDYLCTADWGGSSSYYFSSMSTGTGGCTTTGPVIETITSNTIITANYG